MDKRGSSAKSCVRKSVPGPMINFERYSEPSSFLACQDSTPIGQIDVQLCFDDGVVIDLSPGHDWSFRLSYEEPFL